MLFVPTEHDTLAIIKQEGANKYVVVDKVAVGLIRSAVAVDPITHVVFLTHFVSDKPDSNSISLIALVPSRDPKSAHPTEAH